MRPRIGWVTTRIPHLSSKLPKFWIKWNLPTCNFTGNEKLFSNIFIIFYRFRYVRHRLHEFYGSEHVDLKKPIPMHLMGNVWGQEFSLGNKIKPFANVSKEDLSAELIRRNFTPKMLFEAAEDFFTSINMTKMTESFWKNSIIEKPNDGRDLVCHASAWDFQINDDVRIKQCTRISMESFITVHHEVKIFHWDLHFNFKFFA